jgi:hypothetical protein
MYFAVIFVFVDEYLIYTKDKREMIYLVPQRKKTTQGFLNILYLGIIIIVIYYLDKLSILKMRDIKPSERLLQLMIWGIIIVKGFIFSDYFGAYKFLSSGFKSTGLTRKKENWDLLESFEIDNNSNFIVLRFKNDKTLKVEFENELDKQRLLDIEKYLNEKINVA